jgi:hypothetical protein
MKKILGSMALSLAMTFSVSAETFSDKVNGFTLTAPDAWSQRTPDGRRMPYVVLSLGVQRDGENGPRKALFYVDVFDQDPKSFTTDQYVSRMKAYITNEMHGQIFSDEALTINGAPARKVIYSGIAKKFTENDDRFMRVVVHFDDGKFYVLHCVTRQEYFGDFRPDFESIVSSFRLNDAKMTSALRKNEMDRAAER